MYRLAPNLQYKGKCISQYVFLYSARIIQSVEPRNELYTSPPGRPVHSSDTNQTSLGSILATQQLRTNTNPSHFHHRLYPGNPLYS